MRLSSTTKLVLAIASVVPLAFSEELEPEKVPSACTAICGPIVTLTNACDNHHSSKLRRDHGSDDKGGDDHGGNHGGDDKGGHGQGSDDSSGERACVCNNTSFDVRGVAALCADCIVQNGRPTNGNGTPTALAPPSLI